MRMRCEGKAEAEEEGGATARGEGGDRGEVGPGLGLEG